MQHESMYLCWRAQSCLQVHKLPLCSRQASSIPKTRSKRARASSLSRARQASCCCTAGLLLLLLPEPCCSFCSSSCSFCAASWTCAVLRVTRLTIQTAAAKKPVKPQKKATAVAGQAELGQMHSDFCDAALLCCQQACYLLLLLPQGYTPNLCHTTQTIFSQGVHCENSPQHLIQAVQGVPGTCVGTEPDINTYTQPSQQQPCIACNVRKQVVG